MKKLIASISGIRGVFGEGLDAAVLVHYAGAFGTWCHERARQAGRPPVVVVGRDARITGPLCAQIVTATLQSTGCHVIDAGLAATPTVEMAVLAEQGAGGIVLSASHNPAEWNALKLLNEKGEFLSAEEGTDVKQRAEAGKAVTVAYDQIGTYRQQDYLDYHIDHILALDFIDPEKIAERHFSIVVDGINSVGGFVMPRLLERLGVQKNNIYCLNCEPTGRFAHPAEPLQAHLTETIDYVAETGADLGLVVDPDADRLALIEDGGRYLSEELTQVITADFLWRFRDGPFVTNLSSSRAIEDVAARYAMPVYRSAVGEVNVVEKMKAVGAVLGGEGNGGIILPDLHYGRDALVGAAMVLQHLAEQELTLSGLRKTLPAYCLSKNKIPLGTLDPDVVLARLAEQYRDAELSTLDGVKIDLDEGWVHLRKSNTEPILRIYAEAKSTEAADALAFRFIKEMKDLANEGRV